MRNFIKQTGIISLASIIAFVAWISIQFVYGWTGPTQNPPSGNVPIPIISSRSSAPPLIQDKSLGNLSIGGLFEVALDAIFMENVGIGTDTPTEKLHLEGGNFLQTAKDPVFAGSYRSDVYLNEPYGIYVSGKYAYVTSYSNNRLTILDISNPSNPVFAGSYQSSTYLDLPHDVYVSGKYAYVTSYSNNRLTILDISNPSNPVFAGSYQSAAFLNSPHDVYVSGKYAYVTSTFDHLTILDISNPATPTTVGNWDPNDVNVMWSAFSVYVSGKYAYVAGSGSDNLAIVDISNPAIPRTVGNWDPNNTNVMNGAYSVYVSGKYAYVIGGVSNNLAIVDIQGIDTPTASIGNISASQINVSENMDIRNNLNVGGGLNVGTGGIKTDGDFNMTGTTNTSGGLIIEKRNATQGDPTINLMDGRIWLRTKN